MVWRAANDLLVGDQAALPAIDAGLVDVGSTVRFSHPLVRSAAYRRSSSAERQHVPSRPWPMPRILTQTPTAGLGIVHWRRRSRMKASRTSSSAPPTEPALAVDWRQGVRFLERAVTLTPDPLRRAERAVAAAQAKVQSGAFADAIGLLATAEAGPLGEVGRARVDLVRARPGVRDEPGERGFGAAREGRSRASSSSMSGSPELRISRLFWPPSSPVGWPAVRSISLRSRTPRQHSLRLLPAGAGTHRSRSAPQRVSQRTSPRATRPACRSCAVP